MSKLAHLMTPNLENLRKDLRTHYGNQWQYQWQYKNARHRTDKLMDAYDKAHPGLNAYQLKAAQYEILAENMKTVLFDDSPFFYVNDLCRGPQAGQPLYSGGGWLLRRNQHMCRDVDPEAYARYEAMRDALLFAGNDLMYFDDVHYCYAITNVVRNGLKYYYDRAEANLASCANDEERDFLLSAMAGLKACKRIAQRFGEAARERLATLTDPAQRKNMEMIIDASTRVPWEGCQHFYEALNTMWFCRNTMGEIDGIGNSHLGRADWLLYDYYTKDIADGVLTEQEAYELICKFLLHGDCEYDKDAAPEVIGDHELEMGFVLGGCDEQGNDVYNIITDLFIHAHREQNLIYPKIHYRYSSDSRDEYLNDISLDFIRGRSVGGVVNDDSVIPFLQSVGCSLEDARSYSNYGCWGIVLESKSNCSGGNFVHMLSVMEHTVYGDNDAVKRAGLHFKSIDDAQSFDEVFDIYYENLINTLRARVELLVGKHAKLSRKVNPIPLYTVLLDHWVDYKQDYPRHIGLSFNLAETANVVDSLLAIKHLCFDTKKYTVKEYLDIVRSNWEGHEALRLSLSKLPHYGDENEDSKQLTQRILDGIRDDAGVKFGKPCGMSLLIYQEFRFDAEKMRATPDGRRDKDVVALGVNPTRLHPDSMPALLNSAAVISPINVATHSLTLQMPAANMTVERMTGLLRAAQKLNMKHIQINCVDAETLRDAQLHPENHQDLVIRICGFSAKFVALSPEWQEEVITRAMHCL